MTKHRQLQIGLFNKITFNKSEGHLQEAYINVLVQDSVMELGPTSTDASVDRQDAGATTTERQSLLEEYRTLLI